MRFSCLVFFKNKTKENPTNYSWLFILLVCDQHSPTCPIKIKSDHARDQLSQDEVYSFLICNAVVNIKCIFFFTVTMKILLEQAEGCKSF